MPQPVEPVRGDVQHQSPQEFHGLECQGAQAVAALVILVAEGHLAILQGHEPVVGDGDAMRVAGQVLEDVLGVLEGLFGVDDPVLVAQGGEELLPVRGLGECPTATRQGQLALAIELLEPRQVQPPKTPREDPDGQEEVGPTWHPPRAIGQPGPPAGRTQWRWG